MNQIYACRKGREIPFTDTTSISTVPTAKRSGDRTVNSRLLMGVFTLKPRLISRGVMLMLIAFLLGFAPSNKASAQICFLEAFDGVVAPALPAGWSSTTSGGGVAWVTDPVNSFSAPNNAKGTEVVVAGVGELNSPVINITSAAASITFKNLYNLETGFDGMVLEIKIGGGAFTDIITAGGSFVVGGYDAPITGATNPLVGRMSWTGLSGGTNAAPTYLTTTVNLPAAANGQPVIFKWRLATDVGVAAPGAPGVRIDDISVNCGGCSTGVVTNTTTLKTYCSIQLAIDDPLTLNGHQLNIGAGTYVENVRVYKDLTLNGASKATVIVKPAINGANPGAGTFPAGHSTIFLIQSNGVTIQHLTADGDGPASIGAGVSLMGVDVNARNGIVTDFTFGTGNFGGLDVNDVAINNVFYRGFYSTFNTVPGQTFTLTNYTISNAGNGSPAEGMAILNWGNQGTIGNMANPSSITNSDRGIFTQYSTGTSIQNNTVTLPLVTGFIGIQSAFNSNTGLGTADLIDNNTILNGQWGILVYNPNKNVNTTNNIVTNYGQWGISILGSDPTFATPSYNVTGNEVNGNNVGSNGIVLSSVDYAGFGVPSNVTVPNLNNNLILNNTANAFMFETVAGTTINVVGHYNSLGGPPGTGGNAESMTSTGNGALVNNLTCNWLGSTDPATNDGRVNDGPGVIGVMVYIPYLTTGADSQPGTRGFQSTEVCLAPCAVIQTAISSPAETCLNTPASVTMTGNNGVPPYTFTYTLNGVPQTPVTTTSPTNPSSVTVPVPNAVGTYTYQLTSVTGLNGCTNPPQPPPTSTTTTVRPLPSGTIFNSGGQAVCNGDAGVVNVFLMGSPRFDGTFSISPINGIGTTSTYSWTSMQVGGPQGIPIPAANLTNTSGSPNTYRVAWVSLTDNNPNSPSCTAPGNQLSGSEDITVYPQPNINVTAVVPSPNNGGDICPGQPAVFTVTNPNGVNNATYSFTAVDALGNTLASGNGQPFGAFSNNLGFTAAQCNSVNNPITFTFTPIGPGPLNCQGSSVTRQVNFRDITPPFVSGTLPTTPQNSPNTCLANAPAPPTNQDIQNQYSDGCSALHTTSVTNTVGNSCSWTQTTTYSVADACNNTSTFVFTRTGGDNQAPQFNVPGATALGGINAVVQYCNTTQLTNAQNMTPVAVDNCGGTITYTKTPGLFAPDITCPTRGTITNTFTATDQCGNTSGPFTQVITVQDNTGPVITGHSNQTLNVGAFPNCTAPLPNYITTLPITATDCAAPGNFPAPAPIVYNNNNGGPNTITQSPAPGTSVVQANGQIIPITITATDACGNQSSVQFNVTILDQTPPVARCHDITVNLSSAPVNGGTVSISPSQVDGNATGVAGNGPATPTPLVLSSDNCGLANPALSFAQFTQVNSATFTCANVPNGFQSGTTTVTLWVTDQSNNKTSCVSTITVVDNTAPTFTNCPQGTQFLDRNANCTATLPDYRTQIPINATDNCSGTITYTQSPLPGTIYGANQVAPITVTITATDAHTNSTSGAGNCTFSVQLRDVTKPIFNCTGNQTAQTGAGNTDCSVAVTYPVPTATDNCAGPGFPNQLPFSNTPGGLSTVYLVQGPPSGGQFFVGTTTVVYEAKDASGNTQQCSFTVTVTDNTVPIVVCTGNKSVNTNATGPCRYIHNNNNWNPTPFDNCLLANPVYTFFGSGATTFGPVSTLNGQSFNIGSTTVSVTVMDASGNVSAPCTFTVAVADAGVPSFTSCPSSFTINTSQTTVLSGCRAVVTLPTPTFTTNCTSVLEFFITGATPNSSGIGNGQGNPNQFPSSFIMTSSNAGAVTQVQYRISDANGNSTTCTFFVTVVNNITGTVTGTATATQNASTTSTITFTGINGTPNYTFTYDVNSGSGFGPVQTVSTTGGSSTVTVAQSNALTGTFTYRILSVTDANGCQLTGLSQTATITVVQNPADFTPVFEVGPLSFTSGGQSRDYSIAIVNNTAFAPTTAVPLEFRLTKPSAFTITVGAATASVNIPPVTTVNNSDWIIDNSNALFVKFTLKNTATIPANGASRIGFTVTRNNGVGANTSQSLTAVITNGSGGDSNNNNNAASVVITAL